MAPRRPFARTQPTTLGGAQALSEPGSSHAKCQQVDKENIGQDIPSLIFEGKKFIAGPEKKDDKINSQVI